MKEQKAIEEFCNILMTGNSYGIIPMKPLEFEKTEKELRDEFQERRKIGLNEQFSDASSAIHNLKDEMLITLLRS